MEHQFRKTTALCLYIGALLATITMVLHPTGGSMEYINRIKSVLIFSHSLAISCLPFIGFGAWGLSVLLQTANRISMLGFFVFSFGLIAAMIAAAFNGLVLPYFVGQYLNTDIDANVLKAILGYGRYINTAMSCIFIAACVFAIGLWSVIIILKAQLPKWIGYYGFVIIALGIVGAFTRFNFLSVVGFSVFVVGLVSWLVLAGVFMSRRQIE